MKVELEILEDERYLNRDCFMYKNHMITLEVWHDCQTWYEVDGISRGEDEDFKTLKQAIEYIDNLEVVDESI